MQLLPPLKSPLTITTYQSQAMGSPNSLSTLSEVATNSTEPKYMQNLQPQTQAYHQSRLGSTGNDNLTSVEMARSDSSSSSSAAASASASAAAAVAANKNQETFIHRLYNMLYDPSISHVIWWDEDGETFHIHASDELTSVLAKYFKHSNEQSFIRQLNMYGFHKISDATSATSATVLPGKKVDTKTAKNNKLWVFRHSQGQFKKGGYELLSSVKRRSTKYLNSQKEVINLKTIPIGDQYSSCSTGITTLTNATPGFNDTQVQTNMQTRQSRGSYFDFKPTLNTPTITYSSSGQVQTPPASSMYYSQYHTNIPVGLHPITAPLNAPHLKVGIQQTKSDMLSPKSINSCDTSRNTSISLLTSTSPATQEQLAGHQSLHKHIEYNHYQLHQQADEFVLMLTTIDELKNSPEQISQKVEEYKQQIMLKCSQSSKSNSQYHSHQTNQTHQINQAHRPSLLRPNSLPISRRPSPLNHPLIKDTIRRTFSWTSLPDPTKGISRPAQNSQEPSRTNLPSIFDLNMSLKTLPPVDNLYDPLLLLLLHQQSQQPQQPQQHHHHYHQQLQPHQPNLKKMRLS